ncbi:unnamed protein product [Ectocarpus sp. 4 AP-2014]
MSFSSSSSAAATLAYAAPAFLAPANLKAARRQQVGGWGAPSSSPSARRPRWALSMSAEGGADTEAEASTAEVPEATKRLLEQAAKIRAEAEQMEVNFRKEQGIEDFKPSGAKVSSAGDTARAAAKADPSNMVSQAAAAAAVTVKSTPESRAKLVAELEGLPPNSKEVIEKMAELKSGGLAPRWGSFDFGSRYPISQGQLKMQTGLDGTSLAADGGDMDDLKYALGFVCVFSFAAAVGFGAAIGGNVGASFTYFFALLPIVFLGIGSTAPGVITAVINNVRRKSQDDYEERRVRHEAAHFLSGYLCGLPIKSYKADGGTTLVEFYDSAEGDMSGRAMKFTPGEVDQVSIVAMSGAVGEALSYGTATGGASDLDNLGQIMNQTNPPMEGKEQQSQARWATLMAHRLLSSHEPELKSVMKAFREGKPVSECVAALEGARS